ncbi:hypothetical protein EW145_g3892 [Phellinidium pouzarii]|uniref:Ubiquitin-like domain-containing protein n=1 Tax=Phellinidium pouzarii TaxID=167371 RepID=A0A4S4L5P6_9AGAM|nr:hypothetical protein EW145_g3892 [Phellinidium pouzarii]
MSTPYNAPLTPPLTENDTRPQRASQQQHTTVTSPKASGVVTNGYTVYQDVFQSLSNFAMQNRLSALVDLALVADMNASSESRSEESRLILVAPLVLSYIILGELPSARITLSQLPENLAAHPLSRTLLKLLASLQNRAHPSVYKNAADVADVVQEPEFFDKKLAVIVKLLTDRLIRTFRHKMMELVARAYSSIHLSLAQTYLSLPEEDVYDAVKSYGWMYDSGTQVLHPLYTPMSLSSVDPFDAAVSTLSTVKLVVGGAAQLETTDHSRLKAEIDDIGPPEVWIKVRVAWSGKIVELDIAESDRVYDLKSLLFSMTNVPPDRQKILGLVKGKLPPEEETIANLKLTNGKKFSLIGTPMGNELKDPSQLELLPDVFNDLDVDFSENPEASQAYIADKRNQRKIRDATQRLRGNVNLMYPLREGKKLLVLDIDYTILDTKPLLEGSLPPTECARPRLHEFLETVYPHYDICIWHVLASQIYLHNPLTFFQDLISTIISCKNYALQINFVLDRTCMFKVFSERNGQQLMHHVKPLKVIWNLFPQYSNASNTIHVDDLGRNFALNPGEGLKISAFKEAHSTHAMEDRELEKLARYMVHIADVADLQTVNHKDWKKVARRLRHPQ